MRPPALVLISLALVAAPPAHATYDGGEPLAACPTSSSPGILASGVAVLGTDTATTDCHYRITVSGSVANMRLRANASFAGDHDLYVKHNAPATVGPYFCQANGFSAAYDECQAPLHATGNYHVRVKRWTGASDFLLTVFFEEIPPSCSLGHGVHPLTGAVTANLTSETGAHCMFEYAPPAGSDFVRFTMTPATSDFDMYHRVGAQPTVEEYDCRPYYAGTATETCERLVEGSAHDFVMVRRFNGSGAFTLTPESIRIDEIGPGDVVEGTVAAGETRFFKVVVPARNLAGQATSRLVVALEGHDEGDADLYVRWRAGLPSPAAHECAVVGEGTTGACVFDDAANATLAPLGIPAPADVVDFLGAGRHFIAVRGVEGSAPFRLTAAWV